MKTTLAERDALVSTEPEIFSEWYTSGRFGWVRVQLDLVDAAVASELVIEAWRLTAPKRLVRQYDETMAAR